MRWGDRSFWALRASVDKSHKAIFKQLRAWDAALAEPAASLLTLPANETEPNELPEIGSCEWQGREEKVPEPCVRLPGHLGRAASLLKRLAGHTKSLVENCAMGEAAVELEELASHVGQETEELRKLAPKETKDLEAWRKEVGHIQSRKRAALTSFFKTLSGLGLSYRRGLALKEKEEGGLASRLRSLPLLSPFAGNKRLERLHRRLFRSLARHASLTQSLAKPSPDLGPAAAERCAGFVSHLMHTAQRLFEEVVRCTGASARLGAALGRLQAAASESGGAWGGDDVEALSRVRCAIGAMAADSQLVLRQWAALLRCGTFTTEASGSERLPSPVPDVCLPSRVQNDDWTALSDHLTALIEPRLSQAADIASRRPEAAALCSHRDRELANAALRLSEDLAALHSAAATALRIEVLPCGANSGLVTSLGALQDRLHAEAAALRSWLELVPRAAADSVPAVAELNSALEALLLAMQRALTPGERPEVVIGALHADFERLTPAVAGTDLELRLEDVEAALRTAPSPEALERGLEAVRCALPLLKTFGAAADALTLQATCAANGALRLHSVAAAVFTELLQRGFCRPSEPQEGEGESGAGGEFREGCGLGEGSGLRDVSEEIESEAQLEGLREEEEEGPQEEGLKDEEQGVEMSEDFEGAMHDAEDKEGGDESEEEEEEKEDMEDKMGDLNDAEPEEVDREMWASEDEEERQEPQEQKDRGTGVSDPKAENEMIADDEPSEDQKEQQKEPQQQPQQEPPEDLPGAEEETEDKGEKETHPEEAMETEALELPEDLRLDREDEEKGENGEEMGEEESGDEEDVGEEETVPGGNEEDPNEEDDPTAEGEKSKKMEEEEEEEEESGTGPDTQPGVDPAEDAAPTEEVSGGAGASSGLDALPSSGTAPEASSGVGQKRQAAGPQDEGREGQTLRRGGSGSSGREKETQRQERQIGEASECRSRAEEPSERALNVTETLPTGSSAPEDTQTPAEGDGGLLEHLAPEETMEKALEVMDTATAEQAKELAPPEEEEMEEGRRRKERKREEEKTEEAAPSSALQHRDETEEAETSEAKAQDEKEEEKKEEEREEEAVPEVASSAFFSRLDLLTPLAPELMAELYEAPAASGASKSVSSERLAAAERTWAELEAVTNGLARELTEQLRLILEPTLASKLRGDYRSGKRLNMRKVIPYVASHFRKDKIWLRRTKPHGREYRVLIAVDDSSSMRSNLCMEMTFKALSILTNALGMLEVGRLGVCSFGAEVQFLHPLASPGPVDGPGLLAGFHFDQSQTAISALLHEACAAMAQLPPPSGQAPAAQLLIIISDGLCSEDTLSARVRKAVRESRDQQLFVVFLIIDNPKRKCPVFSVKKHVPAEKEHLLPTRLRDGRSGSRLVSYMEVFPFPFYLVLRDINALPVVLSDALRQWFELIASGATS